jgi:hypothetical protein
MTTSSKGMCFPGLFAGHKGTEGYLRLTLRCESSMKEYAQASRIYRYPMNPWSSASWITSWCE